MDNKKIIFIYRKNSKDKMQWSGTVDKLYTQLKRFYEVEDLQIRESIIEKIKRKINRYMDNVFIEEDFSIKLIQKTEKNFIKKNLQGLSFQFWETPNLDNTDSIIFQDLCVDVVLDLKKNNKELFNKTEFANFSENDMIKRCEYQKKMYEECKLIFTMGKWLKNYICDNYNIAPNKIYSVGGGINIDISKYSSASRTRNKILFVGKNFERKGGPLVVESFKILREKYINNVELYIVGPYENKFGNIEGINFIGNISSDELVYYYNICDIFCMPSYFEAYGLVFGEALCFGLPCIGRKCYAMPEFIKNGINGYLIENDDIEDLAYKMYCLINDDNIHEYVNEMRNNYVQKYSWNHVGEKIHTIIDEKIGENSEKVTY